MAKQAKEIKQVIVAYTDGTKEEVTKGLLFNIQVNHAAQSESVTVNPLNLTEREFVAIRDVINDTCRRFALPLKQVGAVTRK